MTRAALKAPEADVRALRTTRRRVCKAAKVADRLSTTDRETFDAAMADNLIASRSCYDFLVQRTGIDLAEISVWRHRAGHCGCEVAKAAS